MYQRILCYLSSVLCQDLMTERYGANTLQGDNNIKVYSALTDVHVYCTIDRATHTAHTHKRVQCITCAFDFKYVDLPV